MRTTESKYKWVYVVYRKTTTKFVSNMTKRIQKQIHFMKKGKVNIPLGSSEKELIFKASTAYLTASVNLGTNIESIFCGVSSVVLFDCVLFCSALRAVSSTSYTLYSHTNKQTNKQINK